MEQLGEITLTKQVRKQWSNYIINETKRQDNSHQRSTYPTKQQTKEKIITYQRFDQIN